MTYLQMPFFDFHTHHNLGFDSIYNLNGNDTPAVDTFFSSGVHPWNLTANWNEDFRKVKTLSDYENCLAIGECGFDRIWGPDISIQKEAFHAHAKLAYELRIPLILHLVKGHDLLLEYLKSEVRVPQIIWHGYNLKPHLGQQVLDYPVYFSFGKALTQQQSNASSWIKKCPRDRIFLETDDSQLKIDSIYKSASLILQLPEEEVSQLVKWNWNQISSRKIK